MLFLAICSTNAFADSRNGFEIIVDDDLETSNCTERLRKEITKTVKRLSD